MFALLAIPIAQLGLEVLLPAERLYGSKGLLLSRARGQNLKALVLLRQLLGTWSSLRMSRPMVLETERSENEAHQKSEAYSWLPAKTSHRRQLARRSALQCDWSRQTFRIGESSPSVVRILEVLQAILTILDPSPNH